MTEQKAKAKPKAKSLMAKLLEVAAAVAYIQKSETGEQGHYKYVPASVVNGTILPELYNRGVIVYPRMLESTGEYVPEPSASNPHRVVYLVNIRLEYTFEDVETGEKLLVPWDARAKHTDPAKAGGSALTYYGRYLLMNFFGVATDDRDPDSFQNEVKPPNYITSEDWHGFKKTIYGMAETLAKDSAEPEAIEEMKTALWKGAQAYVVSVFKVEKASMLLKENLGTVTGMIEENAEFMAEKFNKFAEAGGK